MKFFVEGRRGLGEVRMGQVLVIRGGMIDSRGSKRLHTFLSP